MVANEASAAFLACIRRTAFRPCRRFGPQVIGAVSFSGVQSLIVSMASTKPSRVRFRPARLSPSTVAIIAVAPARAKLSRPLSFGSCLSRTSTARSASGSPGTAPVTL